MVLSSGSHDPPGRQRDKVESQLWLVVQSSVVQDDSHEATELFNVRHIKRK